MEQICPFDKCTGCGACSGCCPVSCISLSENKNDLGSLHPVINNDICINCGLCQRVCPVNNSVKLVQPSKAMASYIKNDEECDRSSSGGLAYILSKVIIENGGTVYGSVIQYGSNFEIKHERIVSIKNLEQTQGSKYVQSYIGPEIYKAIKHDLKEGRKVLFIGTGCQVAGVRNYLQKDWDNFYAIDIICHGVPSLQLLIDYLRKSYDVAEIKEICFRTKQRFGVYGVYGVYGEIIEKPLPRNPYIMGFLRGLFYRESCFTCPYATHTRCGDLTLGDFWGLKENINLPHRKSKGISLVLLNSIKGDFLLKICKEEIVAKDRPLQEAINGNKQLRFPSKKHWANPIFRFLYPKIGFKVSCLICLPVEKVFYNLLSIINRIKR